MRRIALAVCCLMLFATASLQAGTITANFNSPVGNWGSATATINGIGVHGYQYINNQWVDANLFGRNQSNDRGVGICSTADGNNCGTGSGGGDYNELDNSGGAELIVLKLPDGYVWKSVQLSSLDKNDSTDPNQWERGVLKGSMTGDPNASPAFTTLCDFVTGGAANNLCSIGTGFEPVLGLTGGTNNKYLYFTALDWQNNRNTNNDYLIYSATVTSVPEPGSMMLLGSGLAGVIGSVRRKLQK